MGESDKAAEDGSWRDRRVQVALLAVVVVFVGHALHAGGGVVVDDAYIAFRYASNLAHGAGLTFQGGAHVEGYTCFSWVLLGALAARVGLDPATALPLLGIALGAATVVMAAWTSGRLVAHLDAATVVAATMGTGLFLALSPGLAYFAGSGLETPLYCLTTVLAIGAALESQGEKERRRRTSLLPARAAIASSLALLTRPEGVVVAALALGLGTARAPSSERRPWVKATLAVAGVAAAYAVFKLEYFGALAPNTLAAKPPVLREGIAYVGWGLVDAGPLLVVAAATGLWRRARAPVTAWLVAAVLTLVAVAAVEGGDWMPAGRLLLPAICAGSLLLGALADAALSLEGRARTALAVAAGFACVFYAYWSLVDTSSLHETSAKAKHYEPLRDDVVRRIGQSGAASLGTLDIGRVSYTQPAMRILDLGGLTDPAIARSPGDYRSKRLPAEVLDAEAPDAFLLTSIVPPAPPRAGQGPPEVELYYPVEAALAASPWFQERYRIRATLPIRSDYYLHWYERIPRPGGGS